MLIDTHSHLNFKAFDKDRDKVIKRSLTEGVFMINVGSDFATSKMAVEIAHEHKEGVYAAVALHPIHVKDEQFDYGAFKDLAKNKKVVAIGETGLDAMYPNAKQEEVFLEHLRLANELKLPVILHCRKAHKELLRILKQEERSPAQNLWRAALHCFTGSWPEAKQYLNMGLYLGFNGVIFKYDVAETIKKAPLERILIETDCPYLTPPQEGNKRNEPAFVKYVAQRIAEIRDDKVENISQTTTQNAKAFFGLK